ncbi:unnamed protein product, partial [marine sediment metagenome]
MKKGIFRLGLSFLLIAALVLASCAAPGEEEEEEEVSPPALEEPTQLASITIEEAQWHPHNSKYLLHFTYKVKNTGKKKLNWLHWQEIRATDEEGLIAKAYWPMQHPDQDIYSGETYVGSAEFLFSTLPTTALIKFIYDSPFDNQAPFVLSMSVTCAGEPPMMFEETRSLMGTYVRVAVYSDEETAEEAISAAFARMEEIEKIASIFDEESEAFKLNQDGYLDTPSSELLELISMSLDYSELTDGSFDITCQPLLDLWEYKPDADKQFWEL